MAVRGLGCPVNFTLTAGQKGDAPQAGPLIQDLPAKVVMADTAYDADHLRQAIADIGVAQRLLGMEGKISHLILPAGPALQPLPEGLILRAPVAAAQHHPDPAVRWRHGSDHRDAAHAGLDPQRARRRRRPRRRRRRPLESSR